MRRREKPVVVKPGALPPELAMGPCIEVWARPGDKFPQYAARKAWGAAIEAWAVAHGRESGTARNLGRTRLPWSRDALLANGMADLVDYFETGRGDYPDFHGALGDAYWRALITPLGRGLAR